MELDDVDGGGRAPRRGGPAFAVRPAFTVRYAAPLCAAACLAVLVGLWQLGLDALALKALHVLASRYEQFDRPFADAYNVLAVRECDRLGIDVYVTDPCDLFGRLHNYSPLWLAAPFIQVAKSRTPEVGLVMAILFVASLFLIPPARSRAQAAVVSLGVLSNATFFAVYQGNVDILMFALIAVGGYALARSLRWRVLAYASFGLAGLLKFYPLALLVLALRERMSAFLAVGLASLLAVGAFLAVYGADTARALKIVPTGKITQMSGASILPLGLGSFPYGIRGSNSVGAVTSLGAAAEVLLVALALALAVKLARQGAVREAILRLNGAEGVFLSIGCVLLIACFFAGQSYRYRAIFFIFALPGLASLALDAPVRAVRVLFAATAAAIFLLWSIHLGNGMDYAFTAAHVPETAGSLLFAAFWLVWELVWWGVIGVLAGVLACLLRQLETARSVLRWTTRLLPRAGPGSPGGMAPDRRPHRRPR